MVHVTLAAGFSNFVLPHALHKDVTRQAVLGDILRQEDVQIASDLIGKDEVKAGIHLYVDTVRFDHLRNSFPQYESRSFLIESACD